MRRRLYILHTSPPVHEKIEIAFPFIVFDNTLNNIYIYILSFPPYQKSYNNNR